MQTISQPIQCELPTIPVQIGSHIIKGVSFNESAADNLKLKTVQISLCPVAAPSQCRYDLKVICHLKMTVWNGSYFSWLQKK